MHSKLTAETPEILPQLAPTRFLIYPKCFTTCQIPYISFNLLKQVHNYISVISVPSSFISFLLLSFCFSYTVVIFSSFYYICLFTGCHPASLCKEET